jgi:hypothetical protein
MAISKWSVKDYDTANVYLSEGRKKWKRPLYMRGLHLTKLSNGDIAINDRWSNMTPVVYHRDGTVTISAPTVMTHWGGTWNTLRSTTVRYNILQFSGLKGIKQKQFECYLTFQDAVETPPKIQGCRQCKQTGRMDSWCNSTYCSNEWPCEDHPDAQQGASPSSWHKVPCEHGVLHGHEVKQGQQCYFCNGSRKRDYGSKLTTFKWDGSPIKLKDGNLIKRPPTELEKRIAAYVQLSS